MDCINNIDDVKRFFRYLYEEHKLAFHPDDSFDRYLNGIDNNPMFNPTECMKFDKLMNDCFNICENTNIDIYELACNIRDNIKAA